MKIDHLSSFLDSYYLANTPSFLLSRVLANTYLHDIIAYNDTNKLNAILRDGDRLNASLDDHASAYVALIALLVGGNLPKELSLWTPNVLRWVPEIVSEWNARAVTSVQVENVTPSPQITQVLREERPSNLATYQTFDQVKQ